MLSKEKQIRILEVIPGALVWATFLLAIVFSFIRPFWAIVFIIAFDLYWIIRIFYMEIHFLFSWYKYLKNCKIDWSAKLNELSQNAKSADWQKPNTLTSHDWGDYLHLIFLPTYKEPLEVLRETFTNLCNSAHPLDKFFVILSGEERGGKERFLAVAEQIKKEFGDKFFKLLITVHPADLPDEIPGKGSNDVWAAKQAHAIIDELKIPYERIIVSAFDVDTSPHRQYFSCLTYTYLTNHKPLRASYQPLALYNNNIWKAHFFARVVAYSTTFWLLTDLARPERLFTFSSHSMSFQALVDVGYWQKDIVTEDSRICLQGIIKYAGDYEVIPLYISLSMDAVETGHLWLTLKNQYKQIRRWAWGVENFPYMYWHFFLDKESKGRQVPLAKRLRYIWNQTEGVYSWATAPILMLILGWLPLTFADDPIKATVLAQTSPYILRNLMNIGMIGLFFSALVSIVFMPPKPPDQPRWKYLFMVLQWFLLPVTMILFGAIPAVDAQTHLMLGKYLGFNVTEKRRIT